MYGSFAMTESNGKAHYHLPGLFEFYELYKVFLPLFYKHREYFYNNNNIKDSEILDYFNENESLQKPQDSTKITS